jgi:hypothetical protein
VSVPTAVETYPHRRAGHCGSGALRDLLEHHGLGYGDGPPSEGFAFGLGGGLGFYFFELPEMEPPIYMVGRTGELERDFCRILDIPLDRYETDDPDEGWTVLRDALDRGEPTMIWADIGHLEYLRVKMHNTRHDIVAVAYDDDAGVVYVADNDRDEIQACSYESLARARGSDAFPGPNRHGTWLMDFPAELPPLDVVVERAVRQTVSNMRGGDESLWAVPGAVGLEGAAAFGAAYPGWPERFGDKLSAALRGLRVFIVKAGTGGAMFRSLQAGFLNEAAAMLDDEGLAVAGESYTRLAGDWVALADTIRDDDPAAGHARGLPIAERIAAGEREGIESLESWLGGRA